MTNDIKKEFIKTVKKYYPNLLNRVNYFTKNIDDAKEVLQEALLRSYCYLPKFRGDSRLYTWLYRIATNCAKDYVKKASRFSYVSDPWGILAGLKDRSIIPFEDAMAKQENENWLRSQIDRLPDLNKKIMIAKVYDGKTNKDVACENKLTLGTVKSRAYKSRQKIIKSLSK